MSERRTITIPGLPVGKPRQTRRDRWARRPAVLRYRAWADTARAAVLAALGAHALDQVPLEVHVLAWFPLPQRRRPGVRPGWPYRQKPDADNVIKAVCDALWARDELIAGSSCWCSWDDGRGPRLEVWWRD